MQRLFDALVIGAGPAGTATAARLHQHGIRDVVLIDRDEFPRDKPCGGGLTGHVDAALAALDLQLLVPHLPSHVAQIRFGAYERAVTLQRPVNIVRRLDFDHSLVEQVRAKGLEVRFGRRASRLEVRSDRVRVVLDDGSALDARVVIGADGVASIVRKHLQTGRRLAPHRLFMQEVDARYASRAMIYDFSPMQAGLRGYLWVFPLSDSRVNVGLMHYPSTGQTGAELLRLLRVGLHRHGIELPARGARGWPVWGYQPGWRLSAERLLLVGDAAGIDGLTGEGIAVALEQAQLAGDAVAAALRRGKYGFAGYARALRRAIVGRELALDRRIAGCLYQAGPGWAWWMGMALFDPDFARMYAARVAGTEVLAAQRLRISRVLLRHLWQGGARRRQLARLCGASAAAMSA